MNLCSQRLFCSEMFIIKLFVIKSWKTFYINQKKNLRSTLCLHFFIEKNNNFNFTSLFLVQILKTLKKKTIFLLEMVSEQSVQERFPSYQIYKLLCFHEVFILNKYAHLTPVFSTKQFSFRILYLHTQIQLDIVCRKPGFKRRFLMYKSK